MNTSNIFEKFLFEAPDDVPPDMVDSQPDIPAGAEDDSGPPDMPSMEEDIGGDDSGDMDDGPPDMPDDFGEEDDFGADDNPEDGSEDSDEQMKNLGLDDKISAIMNMNLYQRYLSLLNTIGNQLTMLKNNSDILHTISADSGDIIESLKKLDENVRLYLKNSFLNENYSKNLLFFNKCLNLLKLVNDVFDSNVKKGIKTIG